MYKRVPTQVIVAAYTREGGAEDAVKNIAEAVKDEKIVCTNITTVRKNRQSKRIVKELGKPGLLKGLMDGGAAGASVEYTVGGVSLKFLGPIIGAPVGAMKGAAMGTVAAATVKRMDRDELRDLGCSLEPETSAIVAVFAEVKVKIADYRKEMKELKADRDEVVKFIDAKITKNLKKGIDVAFLLAFEEEKGYVAIKLAEGEEASNFEALLLKTDADLVIEVIPGAEGAAIAPSPAEGVAPVITDDVVEYEVAADKNEEGVYDVNVLRSSKEE